MRIERRDREGWIDGWRDGGKERETEIEIDR